MERAASWQSEFNWYLTKEANPVAHERCLPDYCYHIFEKIRQVTFKAMPKFDDMIAITSGLDALKACKTIEEIKKVTRIDWVRMGIILGIGKRAVRFVEMEAENTLKREGVWGLAPKNGVADLALVFDRSRLEKMANADGIKDVGRGLEQILMENTSVYLEKIPSMIDNMVKLAYLWSPDALADLHKGMAIGMNEFLGADGQLVGESVPAEYLRFFVAGLAGNQSEAGFKTPQDGDRFAQLDAAIHAAGNVQSR